MNSAGDGLIAIMTCYGLGGASHEHSIIRILVAQAATKARIFTVGNTPHRPQSSQQITPQQKCLPSLQFLHNTSVAMSYCPIR